MAIIPLRPLCALGLLVGVSCAFGRQTTADGPFESEIRKFEQQDKVRPPRSGGVVFVGSSSIVGWKTLAKDFPNVNVINRGFGGSELAHSVRYVDRIVTPYAPSMVVLFAGTNDISAGKTATVVATDFKAFVDAVRSKLPKTRIAYISVSPAPSRWKHEATIREANRRILAYCLAGENLVFIDVFHAMLDEKQQPRPELFGKDQLHMNADGYAIWRKIVGPLLPWGTKN